MNFTYEGFTVDNSDWDGNVNDADDIGVTLVYEDAKRNRDFVAELGDLKKTRKSVAFCRVFSTRESLVYVGTK